MTGIAEAILAEVEQETTLQISKQATAVGLKP